MTAAFLTYHHTVEPKLFGFKKPEILIIWTLTIKIQPTRKKFLTYSNFTVRNTVRKYFAVLKLKNIYTTLVLGSTGPIHRDMSVDSRCSDLPAPLTTSTQCSLAQGLNANLSFYDLS